MLLIFDCDGVLVDSEPLACRVDAEVLGALGFAIAAEDIRRRYVGKSLTDMIAGIEAEHGRALPEDFGARLNATLLDRFRTELQPMPGVRDAIVSLPGRRCVASSSLPERVALSLTVTGLIDLFDHRFSSSQVGRGKPAPDLFLFAAEQMGAPPPDCIVIEDSIYGVEAARAAGMRVIGFTGGGHCGPEHADALRARGADAVIGAMADLTEAVRLASRGRKRSRG
jgi:HAD superfamily hydrolase (TIGR01509 family)